MASENVVVLAGKVLEVAVGLSFPRETLAHLCIPLSHCPVTQFVQDDMAASSASVAASAAQEEAAAASSAASAPASASHEEAAAPAAAVVQEEAAAAAAAVQEEAAAADFGSAASSAGSSSRPTMDDVHCYLRTHHEDARITVNVAKLEDVDETADAEMVEITRQLLETVDVLMLHVCRIPHTEELTPEEYRQVMDQKSKAKTEKAKMRGMYQVPRFWAMFRHNSKVLADAWATFQQETPDASELTPEEIFMGRKNCGVQAYPYQKMHQGRKKSACCEFANY